MAHNIETMFSGNSMTPWHRLGVVLPGTPTAAEAMGAAGLDWKVEKVPAAGVRADGTVHMVPGQYAMVRDSDGAAFGCVGSVYKVVQNAEAFDFVDGLIGSGDVRYETAGALNGGRKIWLMARMTDADIVLPGDDRVIPYLLFTNTHDGSESVDVRLCTTRVVCANTLAIALGEGRAHYKIQHRGDIAGKMVLAGKVLGMARAKAAWAADAFGLMAETPLTEVQFSSMLDGLLDIGPAGADKKVSTKVLNIKAEIQGLRVSGVGADLPSAKDTMWGGLQAVTEYVTHRRTTRGDGLVAEANRLESSVYASGAKLAASALDAMIRESAAYWGAMADDGGASATTV